MRILQCIRQYLHLGPARAGQQTTITFPPGKWVFTIAVALLAAACDRAEDAPQGSVTQWQLVVDSDPRGRSSTFHLEA